MCGGGGKGGSISNHSACQMGGYTGTWIILLSLDSEDQSIGKVKEVRR